MVKKVFSALILIAISILCLSACTVTSKKVIERYTIEVGRQVFVSEKGLSTYTVAEKCEIGDGMIFVSAINSDRFIVCDEATSCFGVSDPKGNIVIECKYSDLSVSGNFLCGNYVDYEKELTDDEIIYGTDSNLINEFFYIDGVKLLTATGTLTFQAINDEYCALYYDTYSQVFDKNGAYYFNDRNKVSSRLRYSVCDGLLFGHDSSRGDWFIWEMVPPSDGEVVGQTFVLSFYTSNADCVYALAYLGNGEFVSLESRYSQDDYDYYETIEDETYYFKQTCVIFNPLRGTQRSVDLERPVFGFINSLSPDLSVVQREALNFKEEYTAVSTPVLSEDKKRIATVYYIVDKDLNFIIKYPSGMSPTAMKFSDGYAFAGEASEDYSAALYYMNCDLAWRKNDGVYFGQSFSYGRYVSGKATDNGLLYGVMDSDGDVIVDFVYDFISPFNETCAIAVLDGEYLRMDVDGATSVIEDYYDDKSLLYFSVMGYVDNGKIGIKNFVGDTLIEAEYDDIEHVGVYEGSLYISLLKEEEKTLYILR